MQILKPRTESNELFIMRSLNTRMDLSSNDMKHYLRLEKGYQGEVMFDELTAKLENKMFILNDLCLEVNNSVFQIDSLIIFQNTIELCEVKNYEDDYSYDSESESFKTVSNNNILNPLDQLKRAKTLLRKLLQIYGFHFPVEGNVVFINPEFTLYNVPIDKPIVLPTQLNRYMKKLNQIPSKLNGLHKRIADLLISLHQIKSPYARVPPYSYEHLKKGLTCKLCNSFSITIRGNNCVCNLCGSEEELESAILRIVKEFKNLFTDIKITTNGVYEWCSVIESKKIIRRILKENFRSHGDGRWLYFE